MAYEDIYNRYANLFKSQNNALAQKRDTAIQGYKNQQNDVNNQYTDILNNLNAKSDATKNKYGQLYTQLDQQNVAAKGKNYDDRNNVDTAVNQNLNRVQELMAKNGWLGGGENLQAQLQSGSDRMNGFGSADKNMSDTLTTILNNRNQYQSDEQNALNDIGNQITSSQREKTSKLQQLMDAINAANNNYVSDSNALKAGLDAQAESEIYNQEQQARAVAAQRAAAAQKAASSGASEEEKAYLTQQVQDAIKNGDYNGVVNLIWGIDQNTGQQNDSRKNAIISGMGQNYWNSLRDLFANWQAL